jgi:hypothetical protein
MYGIQPQSLSTKELVRVATLERPEDLPPAWVAEILKRLAASPDAR